MSPLVDPSLVSSSPDEDFKYVCDNPEARRFVENLWEQYKEFADKHFTQEIVSQFHNRFWEMYLACTLKSLGKELLPKKSEGPDIGVKANGSCIWVEAIAVGPGHGPDKVPLLSPDDTDKVKWFRVPEERIVLRYTSALKEKHQKCQGYLKKGVIAQAEPYIIAVNGSKVPYAWDSKDEIPYIIQAVLPFGLPTVWVNWEEPEESTTGYAHRPAIHKVLGSSVPTNIFQKEEYGGISGVLFSRVSIHGFRRKMGEDFILIHNPLALNRLPKGWLKVGREYWVEGNVLESKQ